jgi:hypothetical protein
MGERNVIAHAARFYQNNGTVKSILRMPVENRSPDGATDFW